MERLRRLQAILDVQTRLRDRALATGVITQVRIAALQDREHDLIDALTAAAERPFLVAPTMARLSRLATERDMLVAQGEDARRSALRHGRLARSGERLAERLRDEERKRAARKMLEEITGNGAGQFRESQPR